MTNRSGDLSVNASASHGPAGLIGAKRTTLARAPSLLITLALVGLAVAFYDSYVVYNGQLLWCPPPINGCNEVAASSYARIFGLPVGYYGVVYYLYMFGLAVLLAWEPSSHPLRNAAVLYAGLGVLFSAYFMVLQIAYIHAFCIYCLLSAVTTVLLAVTAVWHLKHPAGGRSASEDAHIGSAARANDRLWLWIQPIDATPRRSTWRGCI